MRFALLFFLFIFQIVEGSRILEDYFVTTSLTSGNQGSGALMASHPTVPNVAYAATSRAFESDTPDNGFSVFAVDIRPGSVTQLGDFYNTTFTSPNGQMAVALAATENNLLVFSIDTTIGAKAPWLTRIPFYSNKSLNLDSVVGPTYIGSTVGFLLYRAVALPNQDNSGYHIYISTASVPYIWISTDEGGSWEGISTYESDECFFSIFSFDKTPAFSISPDGTLLSIGCGVSSSTYHVDIWERNTTTGNLAMVAFATTRSTVSGATRSTISSDAYLLFDAAGLAPANFAWHPTAPRVYYHSTFGAGSMHALDWNGTHLTATTFDFDGYTIANTDPLNDVIQVLGGTQPFKSFYFSIPPDGLSLYTFRSDIGIVTYDINQDDLSLLLATNGTIVGDLASPSDIRSITMTSNGRFFIFSHGATEEAKVNVFTRESRILAAGSSSVSFSMSNTSESFGALLFQHPTLSDIVYAGSGEGLYPYPNTQFSIFALNISSGVPVIIGDVYTSSFADGEGQTIVSLGATESNLIVFSSRCSIDSFNFQSTYQTTIALNTDGTIDTGSVTGPTDIFFIMGTHATKVEVFRNEADSLYHVYAFADSSTGGTTMSVWISIDEGSTWNIVAYSLSECRTNLAPSSYNIAPPRGSFSPDGSLLAVGCGNSGTTASVDIWTRNATDGSLTIVATVTWAATPFNTLRTSLPSNAKLVSIDEALFASDFVWNPGASVVYFMSRWLTEENLSLITWNGTHVSHEAFPFTGYAREVTDTNLPLLFSPGDTEEGNVGGPVKSFYFHIPPDGSALYTWRTDKGVISYTIDPDDPTSLTFATNGTLNGFAADDPSQIRDIMTTQDSTYLLVSYGELGTSYVDAVVIDFITDPPILDTVPNAGGTTATITWTFPELPNVTSIVFRAIGQAHPDYYKSPVNYTWTFSEVTTSLIIPFSTVLTSISPYTVTPEGEIFQQGYYTFQISYQDKFNNPVASDSESDIWVDGSTLPPLLTSPANGTLLLYGDTLDIGYTLDERMNQLNLIIDENTMRLTIARRNAGVHSFSLNPKNIMLSSNIQNINGGNSPLSIEDGTYELGLDASDVRDNVIAFSIPDTVVVVIDMLTTPPVLDAIPSVLAGTSRTFSWTIPDTPLNDSIVFTMTGQSHPNYLPPKTYIWTFSDTVTSLLVPLTTTLTDGAQYSVTPSGEIIQQGYYTIAITYTDFRNNPNASDSQADVQVDGSTLSPLLISPVDGQVITNGDTLDIEYTLYEKMTQVNLIIGENIIFVISAIEVIGTHSFSLDPKNILLSPTYPIQNINFGESLLSLADGTYDVSVTAIDIRTSAPGNSAVATITIDTTTLDPVIVNPNGTLTARCEFTLEVTLDETFSSLYFTLDNGTAVVLLEASEDTSVQYALDCDEFPALAEPGHHEITVYGQDAYSNPVATSSITILVIGAPLPLINHPPNGTTIEEGNLYLITEIDAKEYNTSWVQLRINEQKVDQVLTKNVISNCSGDNLEFSVFLPLNYSHLLSSSGEQKLQICAYENLLQTIVCSQPVYIYMVPEETITCYNITTTVNQTETVYVNSTETVYVNSTETVYVNSTETVEVEPEQSCMEQPFVIGILLVTTVTLVLSIGFGAALFCSNGYVRVPQPFKI